GEAAAAVERLRQLRQEHAEPVIATVLADALFALGQQEEALACLQVDIDQGVDNHWTHYSQGSLLARMGRVEAAAAAFRQSHARQGWVQSLERGYTLSHDYFSGNIPQWRQFFDEVIHQAPIRILEIGSWQGGSSLWLLDHVLGPRGGVLHCVDTWGGSSEHGFLAELGITIEALFDANIARNPHAALVEKKKGPSEEVLPGLEPRSYDLIYIDGAHEASFAIQDAIHAHRLVRSGGFLLFDDYYFQFADPSQHTARAIDFFVDTFHSSYTLLHKGSQVLMQRLPDKVLEILQKERESQDSIEQPVLPEAGRAYVQESASQDVIEARSVAMQLFWQPLEVDGFNEKWSIYRELHAGDMPIVHAFVLPEDACSIQALRLDPAEAPCLVCIERLELRNPGEPLLWSWSVFENDAPPFVAVNDQTVVLEASPGCVLCKDGDPSLLMLIPQRVLGMLRGGGILSITVRWERLGSELVDVLS
ncbi:MAG: class I SAM-dependent methyltransferase, partial [Cyanobacteriota bacterium]